MNDPAVTIARITSSQLDSVTGSPPEPRSAQWQSALRQFTQQSLLNGASGCVLVGSPCADLREVLSDEGWTMLAQNRWGTLHPGLSGTPTTLSDRLGKVAQMAPEFTGLAAELQRRLTEIAIPSRTGTGSAASDVQDRLSLLGWELWPTKIIDDRLPNFIVPVGLKWVQGVFGREVLRGSPLSGANLFTGVHVHFMEARPGSSLRPGARLLWMQRPTGRGRQNRFVGSSVLHKILQGPANDLLKSLGQLPGMPRSEVQRLAGEADSWLTALVCVRPEVFTEEINRTHALAVGLKLGEGRTLSRLPVRIGSPQFSALYRKGVGYPSTD